jgi:hypothetical protein
VARERCRTASEHGFLGHTDPTFTLRVCRHGMRRDAESKAALAALVGASFGQRKDSSADVEVAV